VLTGPPYCRIADRPYRGRVRIAYAADDENETTRAVVAYLEKRGDLVRATTSDAWPEVGGAVGRAVVDGVADVGVVMCWTGTGTAIAANKVPGVRAALCTDAETARGARRPRAPKSHPMRSHAWFRRRAAVRPARGR